MARELDRDFADRFGRGMDRAPGVPAAQHGRLTWLKRQIESKFDEDIAVETVRKWSRGMVRPRDANLKMLAEIFQVDQTWLAFGEGPVSSRATKKISTQRATGAVHYVAGLMMLTGELHVALPREGDAMAEEMGIDLYVIKNGDQRTVTVAAAEDAGGGEIVVRMPYPIRGTDVVIVNATGEAVHVYRLDPERAQRIGEKRNDYLEMRFDAGKSGVLSAGDERVSPLPSMSAF